MCSSSLHEMVSFHLLLAGCVVVAGNCTNTIHVLAHDHLSHDRWIGFLDIYFLYFVLRVAQRLAALC